jgi:C-terminal processing protease CtpA/Prc
VTYEVHGDYLRVLEVDAVSPANTAGLRPDDRITAIDGQRISAIGEIGARQGMDRGAMRAVTVTVVRGDASPQDLEVRVDAVYPAR